MSAGRWWWWEHRRTRAEQTRERHASPGHPHGATGRRAQSRSHTRSLKTWSSLRPVARCVRCACVHLCMLCISVFVYLCCVFVSVLGMCTCVCVCVFCLLVFPSPPPWGEEAIPLHTHPDTLLSTHAYTRKCVHSFSKHLWSPYCTPGHLRAQGIRPGTRESETAAVLELAR